MNLEIERNNLTYWYPKLLSAGIPVPQTHCTLMPDECFQAVWRVLDGNPVEKSIMDFADEVRLLADKVGYPFFLRTGHFSGKHDWDKTCFVPNRDSVQDHILNIANMSELFGMFGEIPWMTWVVREMLPTTPVCTLPAYGNFPLVPEARLFIRGGKIECWHPYWPTKSITNGFRREGQPANFDEIVQRAQDLDMSMFRHLAERVAEVFADDGYWSVDCLPTRRGWYVTDMAVGHRSWHWPECPHVASKVPA